MAITEVGSGSQRASTSVDNVDSTTLAFPANVTSGSLLLVAGSCWQTGAGNSGITVTDTRSTSYTVLMKAGFASDGGQMVPFIAYGIAASSGACTVTVDPSGTGNYLAFTIDELAGVHATPLDVDGGQSTGTSTAPADGLTTAAAGTLLVSLAVVNWSASITFTEPAGSTLLAKRESATPTGAPYYDLTIIAGGAAGAKTLTYGLANSMPWAVQTLAFASAAAAASSISATRVGRVMQIDVTNGNLAAHDWVAVFAAGATPSINTLRAWAYLNDTKTAPGSPVAAVTLTHVPIPCDGNTYDVHLLADDTYVPLASTTFTHAAVSPGGGAHVWFHPAFTGDLVDLFVDPPGGLDQWSLARSQVDVVKFWSQIGLDAGQVTQEQAWFLSKFGVTWPGNATQNAALVSNNAFAKLTGWGIATAIEVKVAYPAPDFTPAEYIGIALAGIAFVESNGGSVKYLVLDEPLFQGARVNSARSDDAAADLVIAFVSAILAAHPAIQIGLIEPFGTTSGLTVSDLEGWISLLITKGFRPAFFHLDVHPHTTPVANWAPLVTWCEGQGIDFGMIYWYDGVATDADYRTGVLAKAALVQAAAQRTDHIVVSSWGLRTSTSTWDIPLALPEPTPSSHAQLLVDVLAGLAPYRSAIDAEVLAGVLTVTVVDDAPNTHNWVGVFPHGATPGVGTRLAWVYLNDTQTAPGTARSAATLVTLPVPTEDVDVLLLANDTYTVLATAAIILAAAPPAPRFSISANTQMANEAAISPTLAYWPDSGQGIINNLDGTYTFLGSCGGGLPGVFGKAVGTFSNPLSVSSANVALSGQKDTPDALAGAIHYAAGGPVYVDPVSGMWIALVHYETLVHPGSGFYGTQYYSQIGIAKSTNQGGTWTDCGIIITPYHTRAEMDAVWAANNGAAGNFYNAEVGWGPYLLVGPYMYVYYIYVDGEIQAGGGVTYQEGMGVARALLADVLTAAATNTVPVFHKYSAGGWTELGIHGFGSKVIPRYVGLTYSVTRNRFIGFRITDFTGGGKIEFGYYESTDGVTWSATPEIVQTTDTLVTPASYWYWTPIDPDTAAPVVSDDVFYLCALGRDPGNVNYRRWTVTLDPVPLPDPSTAERLLVLSASGGDRGD